ncbi:CRISPR-associated endonuclease Cas2 [Desulfurispirillum indicum]|uniref:CRISPR-associated endonuclease Cas2 n=1 Tax=Desulfurispirillum indicum TaxID=936456 RepID=UPI001CFB423F|nr:CRISPR-associated endonuclease Cas2 [Desulfurispirillum indicum]UCZ57717.1 CRISPR-associated endonuclease Cas2 [Desulfurispirillum indicum]
MSTRSIRTNPLSQQIIACHVPNSIRYQRLQSVFRSFGIVPQHALFTCQLDNQQIKQLRSALELLIEPDEDEVRLYFPCLHCQEQVIIIGSGLQKAHNKDLAP